MTMNLLRELTPAAAVFLLELLAIGSAIALTLLFAFSIARTAPPRLRYVLAVLAFAAAAVVPMLPRSPDRPDVDAAPPAGAAVSPNAEPAAMGRVIAAVDTTPAPAYALLAWAVVAAVLVTRELIGHAILHFRRREWDAAPRSLAAALEWPEDVPLYVADAEGPSTVGLLRPVVVLPDRWIETLSLEAAARVARHELAHARWRDPLIHAALRMVRAIFWPSVPLWLLERIARTEREVAADDFAISSPGGGDRAGVVAEYASTLVDAAARFRPRPATATALGYGVGLEERVTRLFRSGRPGAVRLTLAAFVLLCGTAATVALPEAPHHDRPSLHPIPDRTAPQYRQAAEAMNDILRRTRFHHHEGTPTVHDLLARIRSAGTVQPILDALGATDRRTRESVAWIAGQLGDASIVPALVERLRDDDPHVRQSAAWALGMIGDRRAVAPLIAALAAGDASARHSAAWALGRLRAGEAVEPLIARLGDSSADVRHGAAFALGAIGDRRAVPALEALHARSWSPDVREQARRALERLAP